MHKRQFDREVQAQAMAERTDIIPGQLPQAEVEAYRQVYHAIREASLPAPPASFAGNMERLTRDHEEQAVPEIWLARLLAVAVVGGLVAFAPALAGIAAAIVDRVDALPWSTVLAASFALAAASLVDKLARRDVR